MDKRKKYDKSFKEVNATRPVSYYFNPFNWGKPRTYTTYKEKGYDEP
ncbi:MAG: hypothetical protein FWG53_02650 [Clostridiales bacterium]|nr:hypothetical protein [Clostridiales bacterium]